VSAKQPAVSSVPVGRPGVAAARPLVVLYDRDCGLCTASARLLRGWDRHHRLDLVPLQDVGRAADGGSAEASAGSRSEVAEFVSGRRLASALHVVDPGSGRVASGGDGVLEIVSRLPGGWLFSVPGRIPPVRGLIGVGYDVVARNRHRIGRWLRLEGPACDVPR
jgi:predicted DCC family thiol-disulfide oxidoreductase YuxK